MGLTKKDIKLVTDPLWDNNPVTVQVLGICSALAITAQLKAAIVMSLSFTFVLAMGNVAISLLRNVIPPKIRIIAQLIVAAALVIVVYVGLIITNCILMGRFEAFALGNPPGKSFLDALGNAGGYSIALLIVAFFRELLGSGTLLGFQVLGDPIKKTGVYALGYENNGFMLLAPMALVTYGIVVWVQRSRNKALIEDSH